MPEPYYRYERLDLARDAIRLVRLIKGYRLEPIRCELFETYLEEVKGTPYEALSYTWGDQSLTEEIILNGQKALVTSNLHEALCCLRYGDRDRILWIDAICIDQYHKAEKGHQVGQMRFIYKNAENVLVWLGQGNASINIFMAVASYLDKRTTKRHDYRRNSLETWQNEWRVIVKEFGGLRSEVHRQWQAGLSDIVRRSWFGRVWVIQEIASARTATIVCGKNSVATRALVTMPALLDKVLEPNYLSQARAILNIMPGYLRQTSWWNESRDIHTLLKEFRHSEASNQLDRLYALYGLSSDLSDGLILRPDYTITEQDALHNLMSYLIFHEVLDSSVYHFPFWKLEEFFDHLDHFFSHVLILTAKCDGIGHRRVAIKMAQSKLDVDTYDEHWQSPVLYLSQSGCHKEVFQTLLNNPDVDINTTNTVGDTALHIAAEGGWVDIVKLLLRHPDVNVDREGRCGIPPLALATMRGHYAVATQLQCHKSPILKPSCALKLDQEGGLYDILNLLDGWSRLEVYTKSNADQLAILQSILLKDNVDFNEEDEDGRTAIALAAVKGHLGAIKTLLYYQSVDVNHQDKQGKTALTLAAANGYPAAVMLLMTRPEIVISCRDNDGRTPLVLAVHNHHYGIANYILGCQVVATSSKVHPDSTSGAKTRTVFAEDQRQAASCLGSTETALNISASSGYENMVKLSIQHYLIEYDESSNGDSMLCSAAQAGHLNIVKLLLEDRSEAETAKASLDTPFRLATREGHTEIASLLLKYGAAATTE